MANGLDGIGVVTLGNPDAAFFPQLVAGPYVTKDITFDADVDLVATYPGYFCRDLINLDDSGDVLKYKELNDRTVTKTLRIPSAGGRTGLMPVISDLVFASSTALTVKVILQKIG